MPAQKRKAPATPEASGRRRSGRIVTSGKKSQYFEGDTDDEDELGDPGATPVASGGQKKRGRGRPPKNPATNASGRSLSGRKKARKIESDEDDGDDYADDTEDEKATAETDDELDEDEEPRVTITPLAKMRDEGGVPYEDERVHKNTMLFLKDLKANNKRSWLKGTWESHRSLFLHFPFLNKGA